MHASSVEITVSVSETAGEYLLAGAGELATQGPREPAGYDLGVSVVADESEVAERMAREPDDDELRKAMDDAVGPPGLNQVHDLERAVNTGKLTWGGYDG